MQEDSKQAILEWFTQCSDGGGLGFCFTHCNPEQATKCKKALSELGLLEDAEI